MTEHTRVVVIGGGIVGCSVLYGLARLGWSDVLLIEKNNLTSGSTWHAAGNVTYFGHYPSITRLYVNSVKTYLQAEKESGQNAGFHRTGSLRLATTESELQYYRQLQPIFDELGVEYNVILPEEIPEYHPLLVTDDLYGAAHTPTDGHVDASGATYALAKAARLTGAKTRVNCTVRKLENLHNGNWVVHTDSGKLTAEHVVIAASFWSRELVQSLGLNLPLYAVEHHALTTDKVPELISLGFELPTVRDPYPPSNVRQEGNGLICGVYEPDPKLWSVDGIPEEFEGELLVPEIERLEPYLLKLIERLPAFGRAGIKTVYNGVICYTPDGLPLLGPVDTHPGLWLAAGFCIGIGTGGGSGEFLASWIVNGEPQYELPLVYPSRFTSDLAKSRCIEMIVDTYASGYAIHSSE